MITYLGIEEEIIRSQASTGNKETKNGIFVIYKK